MKKQKEKKQFHEVHAFRFSLKTKRELQEIKKGKGTWEYFFKVICENKKIINSFFKKNR